ncbi:LUD domain-containing protein [Sulfolobus acidocaldarius]|uniref:Conserved Archaeal 4Fe-4S binding domain protein n=4 Tax=Sulfolobus acidocaldarius TaxID=2285 RepID=Q4J8A4_SULAC|nr:lactate utilization protein B [Sulfolobus acidocaldarius]AAY80977.1 conserved Archaeal 4Fe-4S binding domain protein [Sulfolobus acidocaldarius DSM 639]AGE71578.1 4Fe-4S binding domain-containing protein [Sulfolobus acidocaldarius N8]AGE73851.1 4Fe-4S binding domain-containing protein [Sulfolobus acidocaldarius Ron12/I]ALU30197.1 (Fe-S)-binding protein [Sulfolobus acidocaldarius]ALU30912.1 (Fe-S)-binding protein [Sulfolobus acidocaldarius]
MSEWEIAVNRAINNNVPKVFQILNKYPYILELAKKLREAKLQVLSNPEKYIEETINSVKRIGGNAYFVRDANEAREVISKIVGSGKKVVMGKSMVAYEIGLRKHLQSIGNEVWETDLGEFLIQLADEPPSHILAPAVHMTKERIAKLIREKLHVDVDVNSSHEELVAKVREFLREKFVKADVGITGANAVAADTGSVILVENEGNIRMSSVLPTVHIAVAGVEKIVPTFYDALTEATVQAAFAGLYPPTYINVSSGPSSTGDIEMKRVSPAHGPKEFHLVIVDNGRIQISKDEILKETLLCIRCGRCHMHCPVYRVEGVDWGDPPYTGPMGAMWSYAVYRDTKPAMYCMHSGNCKEVCPMKINIPRVLERIKAIGNGSVRDGDGYRKK